MLAESVRSAWSSGSDHAQTLPVPQRSTWTTGWDLSWGPASTPAPPRCAYSSTHAVDGLQASAPHLAPLADQKRGPAFRYWASVCPPSLHCNVACTTASSRLTSLSPIVIIINGIGSVLHAFHMLQADASAVQRARRSDELLQLRKVRTSVWHISTAWII